MPAAMSNAMIPKVLGFPLPLPCGLKNNKATPITSNASAITNAINSPFP
jgi:hypothetical protein